MSYRPASLKLASKNTHLLETRTIFQAPHPCTLPQ